MSIQCLLHHFTQTPVHARSVVDRQLDVLFRPGKAYEDARVLNAASHFRVKELLGVTHSAQGLLGKRDSLLYVSAPCSVVSDIHGQFAGLVRMLGWCGAYLLVTRLKTVVIVYVCYTVGARA